MTVPASTLRIAVIGTGVAGLSAAWLLGERHDVTLYDKEFRPGGHSHTVTAETADGPVAVDTGFIVYNETNYPNLTALLAHLDVATEASDMSFAVSLDDGGLEYSGGTFAGLFAQKRNMFRPRFWSMLNDLNRFYREAPHHIALLDDVQTTLGDFLTRHAYGRAFQNDHLLPLAGAIWSAQPLAMLNYPAGAFLRFQHNHGLLRVFGRPAWRTVTGGSQTYVQRILRSGRAALRLNAGVSAIERRDGAVRIVDRSGASDEFDHVVIASHADQALAMLADPDASEQRLLGAFAYSQNETLLHSDAALMPRRRGVWSSWNYLGRSREDSPSCVSYWMNRLQNIPERNPLFVTLNPTRSPREGTLLHSQVYEHPVLDGRAMTAQRDLWSLQGRRNTWFCGSYFGAGFHEDALQSGLAVAEQLGGVRRPWSVEAESGRIRLPATPTRPVAAGVPA